MNRNKPRGRVLDLAGVIKDAKINRRRLSEITGVSYNTIRALDDGANVTIDTFEAIEAGILQQKKNGERDCGGCRYIDQIDNIEFCEVRLGVIGEVRHLTTRLPCIAWRAKK